MRDFPLFKLSNAKLLEVHTGFSQADFVKHM